MPQIDIDGANSKISADTIRGQSGTTVTVQAGHNLVGSGSGLTALPASNLTGTLPAIDGSNLTGVSGGKILQGPITDRWPERLTATHTSKAVVDNDWSATITPSATSSKVLVQVQFEYTFVEYSTSWSSHFTVYRDSTDIDPTASTSWQHGLWVGYSPLANMGWQSAFFQYVDSPNSTSALVYKPWWWVESGLTMRIGAANNTTDNLNWIHLWEIGA